VTLWHYLRGTAFARTNRLAEAETERAAVAAAVAATGDQATLGNNSRKRVFDIADHMLAGEIAAARQQTDVAVRALEEAVRIEDELAYAEPGDWPLPARHTLGAVLLAAGRPADAERVYLADLQRHPETGWSLRGLSEALRAQRRPAEADAVMKRFAKAWAHADLAISSSRL
jgi:tetratricopeptide (TPR) repeat protein